MRVDITIELYTIIGLLEIERQIPQKVVVEATFFYQYNKERFLDYALATKLIKEHLKAKEFYLIEEALLSLEEVLKERFPFIEELSLTITKPQILPDATPSVTHTKRF